MRTLLYAAVAMLLAALPASAQSVSFHLGDLIATTGSCMRDTMPADGRKLPMRQNQALYSLFGHRYGGDGKIDFALPDLSSPAAKAFGPKGDAVVWCVVVQGDYPPRPDH